MPKVRLKTDEEVKVFMRQYGKGLSIQTLADRNGVAYSTMHGMLQRAGCEFRRPGKAKKAKKS
jgi:hypothetical protein